MCFERMSIRGVNAMGRGAFDVRTVPVRCVCPRDTTHSVTRGNAWDEGHARKGCLA